MSEEMIHFWDETTLAAPCGMPVMQSTARYSINWDEVTCGGCRLEMPPQSTPGRATGSRSQDSEQAMAGALAGQRELQRLRDRVDNLQAELDSLREQEATLALKLRETARIQPLPADRGSRGVLAGSDGYAPQNAPERAEHACVTWWSESTTRGVPGTCVTCGKRRRLTS